MPAFLKKLFGTAGLQNQIDQHVKDLGLPKVDEDENRLISLGVMAFAIARYDPSMLNEVLVKGRFHATPLDLAEAYKLNALITRLERDRQYPFDAATSREMQRQYA